MRPKVGQDALVILSHQRVVRELDGDAAALVQGLRDDQHEDHGDLGLDTGLDPVIAGQHLQPALLMPVAQRHAGQALVRCDVVPQLTEGLPLEKAGIILEQTQPGGFHRLQQHPFPEHLPADGSQFFIPLRQIHS